MLLQWAAQQEMQETVATVDRVARVLRGLQE
jgi:hypothetical protein